MKTPAEDINNDMEKGEMVIEERELTVDDEERIKSELIRLVTIWEKTPKIWTIQLKIDVLMFMIDFKISKLLMLGLER